ncbi:hypothetical protein NQZ68_030998 [Dissostichus eleginoides]|nr:hypothetical protein NQZ68_030998 [Dissostichus eleginoides]
MCIRPPGMLIQACLRAIVPSTVVKCRNNGELVSGVVGARGGPVEPGEGGLRLGSSL